MGEDGYEWLPDFIRRVKEVREAGWGKVTIEVVNGNVQQISHEVRKRFFES